MHCLWKSGSSKTDGEYVKYQEQGMGGPRSGEEFLTSSAKNVVCAFGRNPENGIGSGFFEALLIRLAFPCTNCRPNLDTWLVSWLLCHLTEFLPSTEKQWDAKMQSIKCAECGRCVHDRRDSRDRRSPDDVSNEWPMTTRWTGYYNTAVQSSMAALKSQINGWPLWDRPRIVLHCGATSTQTRLGIHCQN